MVVVSGFWHLVDFVEQVVAVAVHLEVHGYVARQWLVAVLDGSLGAFAQARVCATDPTYVADLFAGIGGAPEDA